MSDLASRGLSASVEGVTIAVEGVGDAEYDQIRDSLVEVGARLRRLGPHRRRLTEIFRDNHS